MLFVEVKMCSDLPYIFLVIPLSLIRVLKCMVFNFHTTDFTTSSISTTSINNNNNNNNVFHLIKRNFLYIEQ